MFTHDDVEDVSKEHTMTPSNEFTDASDHNIEELILGHSRVKNSCCLGLDFEEEPPVRSVVDG